MLDRFFKTRNVPLVFRLVGLLSFVFLLILLVYGSVRIFSLELQNKTALYIIWTVWWPFLYVTLFFIARGWCGFFCPLSLANEAGNYVRKGKGLNILRWSFAAYIIFFLVVFLEQSSGLFLSPRTTLLFFILFLGAAFLAGIIWQRFIFCRLLCPIGTLLGVFSRLSIIGVRTKKEICEKCLTKDCLKGTEKAGPCPMYNYVPGLNTNKECLLCTNCIKNCPHQSAQLKWVVPGKDILERQQFRLSESLFIVALLGLTVILTSPGTQLARKAASMLGIEATGVWLRGMDFMFAVGIVLGMYLIVSLILSRVNKQPLKENLVTFGYGYLPLVFCIMAFTIVFGFLAPSLELSEKAGTFTKYTLMGIGTTGSLYLLLRLGKQFWEKIAHTAFLGGVVAVWVLLLIPGSLGASAFTEQAQHNAHGTIVEVVPGQMVDMNAFSMGFDPMVLKVKKDTPVVLNMTNSDIIHAFDIDELDVHLVLPGGKTARVMFTPTKAGEFKFYCSIPGHEEAGMKGKLIVTE